MNPEWERRRIATFAKRSKVVNVGGDRLPPLSITKGRGVILQSEKYNKQIATDLRKYVIARHGQFAFDPMSLYYGAIGQVAPIEVGLVSPDYVVFDVDDTVDGAFLNYYLRWPDQIPTYEAVAETGNQFGKRRRVYWSVFENLEVRLPPLGEQRRIAAILASVDHAIEATQAVIDQLQIVKKAMMAELLTRGLPGQHTRWKQTEIGEVPQEWEVVPLGDLSIFVTSGSRGWAQFYSEDGALFIRIANLERGTTRLDLGSRQYVRLPEGTAEGVRTRVASGDLLISITADLGIVGLVPVNFGEAYINQHIALVRLNKERVYPAYVANVLAGGVGQNQVRRLNDGGTKAGLNLSSVRQLMIPLPPLGEQAALVEPIETIEDRLAVERDALVGLLDVRTSLMAALLTGELRVTPDESDA